MRYLPRNRKQALVALGLGLVLLGGVWAVRTAQAARRSFLTNQRDEVEGLIGQFQLVRSPLMPSHWMTRHHGRGPRRPGDACPAGPDLEQRADGVRARGVGSRRLYRTAFDRIAGGGRAQAGYRSHWLDRVMEGLVFYLDRPTRVLMVKDFRTFRRDPTQWVSCSSSAGCCCSGRRTSGSTTATTSPVMDKYASA